MLDHLLALVIVVATLTGGLLYLGVLTPEDLKHLAHTALLALDRLIANS